MDHDFSLFDFSLSDNIIDSLSGAPILSLSIPEPSDDYIHMPNHSPPKHPHDGTSPLPLGMEFSPLLSKSDGQDFTWSDDSHIGWNYCVTIPSWIELPKSSDSDPMVLYKVQVHIHNPDGVTTTRATFRRFNEFLKLLFDLKKAFPQSILPSAPPRMHFRLKTRTLLEGRRRSLEEWMEKLLSDINISRSAPVAIFLDLEAAARSSFADMDQISNSMSNLRLQPSSTISVTAAPSSFVASDHGYDSFSEKSEMESSKSSQDIFVPLDNTSNAELEHFSGDNSTFGVSNSMVSESNNFLEGSGVSGMLDKGFADIGLEFPGDSIAVLPFDEWQKTNRVLSTMEHRLATAKTDMEDLIARFNQELALRQCLTTKVKDLEVELETTIQNCKDNLQQSVLIERERFTQMQWDVETLRTKCLELELNLKAEQEAKSQAESSKMSVIRENHVLVEELNASKEQLKKLQKDHEVYETKSKVDFKVLVKEVKFVRNSNVELKRELGRVMKEKIEVEKIVEKERKRREVVDNANEKLLHECEILHKRLLECSIDFTIDDNDKLVVDASTPFDAIDLLTTSDNRIGLLLAEAQLLAQDVESGGSDGGKTREGEVRKMVTDMFIDNATLRKQVNSVIRCSLEMPPFSENDEDENTNDNDNDDDDDE